MRRYSHIIMLRLAAFGDPVTIPESLIEKLRPFGPHFLKVAKPIAGDKKSGKDAVEHGFPDKPYNADDSSLQEWLKQGCNYGVLAGDGLAIVETDTKETTDKMNIVNTLTVQSGSGRGRHFYILTNATENGVVYVDKENVANIQVERKYVVGPGSRHFTGNFYKIVNDAPIAFVSKQTLDRLFGVDLTWTGQRRIALAEAAEQERKEGFDIPIDKVINLTELSPCGSGIYRGSHPIHGSTSGKNFDVNTKLNMWHCFRCNSGGGSLSWIAVKHGIIECREAPVRHADKGFIEALEKAKEDGFDVKVPDEELSPTVKRFFEKDESGHKRFVPVYLAAELMKEHHFRTRSEDKTIFCYNPDTGVYQTDGQDTIDREITKKLGKYYSIHRHRETYDYILKATVEKLPMLPENKIAVKNGILDIHTRELQQFNPDFFVVNALPVAYDANAKCPGFVKFLESAVPEKADRDTLQEFAGYILSPDCHFEKALMLIGVGANGKSTLLAAWTKLIGKQNISAVSLQELGFDRFALVTLFGKMANICADLHNVPVKDAGIFMKLVTGDQVSAQEKFKGRFDFNNRAKLAYASNNPPKPPEDIDAYFRRWLLILFPNIFADTDPKTDKYIIDKITTLEELGGLLNWALDGLQRLMEKKTFTGSMTNEKIKAQYTMLSNPQKAFVEACLVPTATREMQYIEGSELYLKFKKFCADNKLCKIASKIEFGRELQNYITDVEPDITKSGEGKTIRIWRNIRFREPGEMTLE